MATLRGSWQAIPMLEKNGGGAIIHISTISALTESMRTPPYGAIKAAVNHYTVTQAKSLAPIGIRVNAICPGSIYFEGGVWDDAKKNHQPYTTASSQYSIWALRHTGRNCDRCRLSWIGCRPLGNRTSYRCRRRSGSIGFTQQTGLAKVQRKTCHTRLTSGRHNCDNSSLKTYRSTS